MQSGVLQLRDPFERIWMLHSPIAAWRNTQGGRFATGETAARQGMVADAQIDFTVCQIQRFLAGCKVQAKGICAFAKMVVAQGKKLRGSRSCRKAQDGRLGGL